MERLERTESNLEKLLFCQRIVDKIQTKSKRPVCRLTFCAEDFSVTDSHLGGVPYLPHEQAYPVGADGQRLWLCAQINFAQMPVMEGFPQEGILQFFLSDWDYDGGFGLYSESPVAIEQEQWRVLYYPCIDTSVTEAECKAKMPAWQEGDEDLWRTPSVPMKMDFLPVDTEGVGDTDYRFEKLFAEELSCCMADTDAEAYMPCSLYPDMPAEQEVWQQIQNQIDIGGCKIGGYPRYEQDDPRLYSQDCQRDLEAWDTLLFQLDDHTFTVPAGDAMDFDLNGGTLNFLMRSEDLKNRDFSAVLAQWSCS